MSMTGKEITEMQKKYNLQSWSAQKNINPTPVEKAEGIYYWDYDGKRHTDMSSQLVNLNLGYGNKAINEAIKEQVDKYCFVGPSLGVESRAKLAKKIVDLMPDNMGKVFFTNAGADANENAIKIARMYTGRNKIFSRYRSYHGSSFGAGNLTGEPRRFPLEPGVPGFIKFMTPYVYREAVEFESEEAATKYYLTKLREQIIYENPDNIAAIVMETITGSNGVIIPPKGYLPGVRKICDEFGILMICDEVMAGWGRTGKMFAFENFEVQPDIVTFAKGVTCGYVQLGGCVVSKDIAAYFDDHVLSCGLTYSAHPLACAAGCACVDYYIDNNILDNVNKVGKVLGEKLEEEKANGTDIEDAAIQGVKIGMMGPLAGIGDPVFWFTVRPILGALGASLAQAGNIAGPLIFFIGWNLIRMAFLWYTQELGYKAGSEITKDMSGGILKDITKGASILGMFILAVLVERWVSVVFTVKLPGKVLPKGAYIEWPKGYVTGDQLKTILGQVNDKLSFDKIQVDTLQKQLDSLIPGLTGLLLTFACMWLLKKKVSPITIIIGLFVVGIVASFFGIM